MGKVELFSSISNRNCEIQKKKRQHHDAAC